MFFSSKHNSRRSEDLSDTIFCSISTRSEIKDLHCGASHIPFCLIRIPVKCYTVSSRKGVAWDRCPRSGVFHTRIHRVVVLSFNAGVRPPRGKPFCAILVIINRHGHQQRDGPNHRRAALDLEHVANRVAFRRQGLSHIDDKRTLEACMKVRSVEFAVLAASSRSTPATISYPCASLGAMVVA